MNPVVVTGLGWYEVFIPIVIQGGDGAHNISLIVQSLRTLAIISGWRVDEMFREKCQSV